MKYSFVFLGILFMTYGGISLAQWEPLGPYGGPAHDVAALALDPMDTSTIYVGTLYGFTGALFKSTDGAANWSNLQLSAPDID